MCDLIAFKNYQNFKGAGSRELVCILVTKQRECHLCLSCCQQTFQCHDVNEVSGSLLLAKLTGYVESLGGGVCAQRKRHLYLNGVIVICV